MSNPQNGERSGQLGKRADHCTEGMPTDSSDYVL